jgi:hypothetical protein
MAEKTVFREALYILVYGQVGQMEAPQHVEAVSMLSQL